MFLGSVSASNKMQFAHLRMLQLYLSVESEDFTDVNLQRYKLNMCAEIIINLYNFIFCLDIWKRWKESFCGLAKKKNKNVAYWNNGQTEGATIHPSLLRFSYSFHSNQ